MDALFGNVVKGIRLVKAIAKSLYFVSVIYK